MTKTSPSLDILNPKKVDIETQGFEKDEIVKIHAISKNVPYHSFYSLGQATKPLVEERVERIKKDPDYEKKILEASQSLDDLECLSKDFSKTFTTRDGVNYLERYIDALRFFGMGAAVCQDDLAYIQIEDRGGCQTLLIQNKYTKEIVGLHMEEDSTDYKGEKGEKIKNPLWGKRWVEMETEEGKASFCSYGGVLSFGVTSGVVESKDGIFFQAGDSIGPTPKGKLWANAFAFMIMDCADFGKIKELIENINRDLPLLPKPIFSGGYILHMVQAKNGKVPEMLSLEFGGDIIKLVKPQETKGRSIFAGINLPSDQELKEIDSYNLPQQERESDYDYECRVREAELMEKRYKRLSLIGKSAEETFKNDKEGWGKENSLNVIKKVLANKHGEWLGKWFTGFSNYVVAQHDFFYLSPKGEMKLIVRKGSPDRY